MVPGDIICLDEFNDNDMELNKSSTQNINL